MTPVETIADRLAAVRRRIADAAARCGHEPSSVTLVIASKTQPADAIRTAYEVGARDFGENYVQEALSKQRELADLRDIRWHLIGHLQTNKARDAAHSFALIHTLDSARLAAALARSGARARVLIEVNLGGETSKSGVLPADAERLIEAARTSVEIAGLMAIPPPARNPAESHGHFAMLRKLRDSLAARSGLALSELSMGMSDDFEIAIEEGATIVRVGRAIMGERAR